MGKMEEKSRISAKRARVKDVALLSLYGVAAITMMAAMPNALRLLKWLDPLFENKRDPQMRLREAMKRLEKNGYIRGIQKGKKFSYELTEKGRRESLILYHTHAKATQRKWDGKWRIIIYDVWEKRSKIRQQLRYQLQQMGFVRLQDSVWVTPYSCEELIALLRAEYKLGQAMLYIIADGIENDKKLRESFELP